MIQAVRELRKTIGGTLAGEIAAGLRFHEKPELWRPVRMLDLTSHHECGHAIFSIVVLGRSVKELRIFPDGSGYCAFEEVKDPVDLNKEPNDFSKIESNCNALAFCEFPAHFERLRGAVKRLLQKHWPKLKKLATALLEKRILRETEILQIIKSA
jgi:ATP-dependent Zn protease